MAKQYGQAVGPNAGIRHGKKSHMTPANPPLKGFKMFEQEV